VARSRDVEIARADPKARRRAFWCLSAIAVLGFVSILVTSDRLSELEAMAERDPETARRQIEATVGLISLVNAAALLPVVGYFGYLSVRVFRSGRFPPPNIWLIRDTRIVRGARARWAGTVAAVTSALFLVLAVLPLLFWRVFLKALLGAGGG
jgi:hypothetical protein